MNIFSQLLLLPQVEHQKPTHLIKNPHHNQPPVPPPTIPSTTLSKTPSYSPPYQPPPPPRHLSPPESLKAHQPSTLNPHPIQNSLPSTDTFCSTHTLLLCRKAMKMMEWDKEFKRGKGERWNGKKGVGGGKMWGTHWHDLTFCPSLPFSFSPKTHRLRETNTI